MKRIKAPSLTDDQVEALVSDLPRRPTDLDAFVSWVRDSRGEIVDDGFIISKLAMAARAAETGSRRTRRRLSLLGSAGALVFAFAATAIASDSAAPGDPLYFVDRWVESLGWGGGGVEERILEYDTLIEKGDQDAAIQLLTDIIESADELETERALHHLTLAETKINPNAEAAQVKVAQLQEFITKNKGSGVGLDGRDLGKAISEIARNGTSDEEGAEWATSSEDLTGPPDHAGPKDGKDGPPEHAGPKKGK